MGSFIAIQNRILLTLGDHFHRNAAAAERAEKEIKENINSLSVRLTVNDFQVHFHFIYSALNTKDWCDSQKIISARRKKIHTTSL